MTDRNKEELQFIYDDLQTLRTAINQLAERERLESKLEFLFHQDEWEQKRDEHFSAGINGLNNLIQFCEIQSCEVVSWCESEIRKFREYEEAWQHDSYLVYSKDVRYFHSSRLNVIGDDVTLDDLIDRIDYAINGRLDDKEMELLEEQLDSLKGAACYPRAMLEIDVSSKQDIDHNASLPMIKPTVTNQMC